MKKQPERPVLITDAARSQGDQFRSRQIRYVTMMGLRLVCLIVGGILVSVHAPLLPLWLTLCVIGVVLLPWIAVMIANDRPARSKAERAASVPAETPQPMLAEQSAEEVEYLTIDSDVVDEQERWEQPAPAEQKHRSAQERGGLRG